MIDDDDDDGDGDGDDDDGDDDDHLCCQAAPSRVADWDIGDSRPLLTASGSKRVWRGGCGWSTSWLVVAVEVLAQMQSLPRRR